MVAVHRRSAARFQPAYCRGVIGGCQAGACAVESDGHSTDQRRSSGPALRLCGSRGSGARNHRQPRSGFLGQSDAFCRFAPCAAAIPADLEPVEDFYRARWRPVFAGADATRLSTLARAMPHACRALTITGADGPPATSAQRVLNGFIGEMVDYLVRSAVMEAGSSWPNGRNGRVAESAHDQWLQALRGPDGVIDGGPPEL